MSNEGVGRHQRGLIPRSGDSTSRRTRPQHSAHAIDTGRWAAVQVAPPGWRAVRETPAYAATSAPPATAGRTALHRPLPAGLAGVGLGALGTAAAGAIVGLCSALVLAAAERPSLLSGPARHGFPRWMVGPLAGRFGGLPASPPAISADLVRVLVLLGALWLVV